MADENTPATRPDRSRSARSAPAARVFPWEKLPRTTRSEVARLRGLGGPPGGVCAAIAADLSVDLGCEVLLELESVAWREAWGPWPEPGCIAAVELEPQPGEILADVDLGLALAAADRLLGGAGAAPSTLRPASAVERGALSYLFLRALARLDAAWLREAGLRPRLRRLLDRLPESQPASGLAVRIACRFREARGTVRLWVPEATCTVPALRARRSRAPREVFSGLGFELSVEVARAHLAAEEIRALAPRDVVVCDPGTAALSGGVLGGEVGLRVPGSRCLLACTIAPDEGRWRLEVRGLRAEGEEIMAERHGERVGEDLLAEARLPVAVELGRLTLSGEEIAGLRPGDTLLLGKPPGAPVDLVVGGRLFARGELVDVEGEIGVRVIALA